MAEEVNALKYTIKDIAKLTGKSKTTIAKYVQIANIKTQTVGNKFAFTEDEKNAILSAMTKAEGETQTANAKTQTANKKTQTDKFAICDPGTPAESDIIELLKDELATVKDTLKALQDVNNQLQAEKDQILADKRRSEEMLQADKEELRKDKERLELDKEDLRSRLSYVQHMLEVKEKDLLRLQAPDEDIMITEDAPKQTLFARIFGKKK